MIYLDISTCLHYDNLPANREQIFREYFQEFNNLNLGELFVITMLMKRIMALTQNGNKLPGSLVLIGIATDIIGLIQICTYLLFVLDLQLRSESEGKRQVGFGSYARSNALIGLHENSCFQFCSDKT